MLRRRLYIFLLIFSVHFSTLALESDLQQPVEIAADKMQLDEKNGIALYEGNVRLSQGSISITAEKISLSTENNKLQRIRINGNSGKGKPAEFQQETEAGQLVRAQAEKMDFNIAKSRLVLTGQAELMQGKNIIRSERIDYNTLSNSLIAGKQNDNTSSVSGQNRVHIVITPDQK